jgi:hypothetical protein
MSIIKLGEKARGSRLKAEMTLRLELWKCSRESLLLILTLLLALLLTLTLKLMLTPRIAFLVAPYCFSPLPSLPLSAGLK